MNHAPLIHEIQQRFPAWDLGTRLQWIEQIFPQSARFSTSFGAEDQAISHAISQHAPRIQVFTLDTGRLFEETYRVFAATRDQLGLRIETYYPDPQLLQEFTSQHGPNAFYESVELRLRCCQLRKVEPLSRALRGAQAWVTGIRRSQNTHRADLPFAEWDELHHLIKIHPLLDWSAEALQEYLQFHAVPLNRLHAKGFPSIGCAPCTRAVAQGADPRSGRWWWENPNKKECGLHLPANPPATH